MNKKNNRKGFTIVELVIVIAVIAILATVLIPTFGNVIEKANNTALIQEIKNEHTNYVTHYADDTTYSDTVYILLEGKYYLIEKGELQMETVDELSIPDEQDMPTDKTAVVFCAVCDATMKPEGATVASAWTCTTSHS